MVYCTWMYYSLFDFNHPRQRFYIYWHSSPQFKLCQINQITIILQISGIAEKKCPSHIEKFEDNDGEGVTEALPHLSRQLTTEMVGVWAHSSAGARHIVRPAAHKLRSHCGQSSTHTDAWQVCCKTHTPLPALLPSVESFGHQATKPMYDGFEALNPCNY